LKWRNGSVINYVLSAMDIFFLAKDDDFSVNDHY
jgi:hypothetical protein